MKATTKLLFGIFALGLFSCNGPSLEKYYVDHQEQDGFVVLNIPTSTLIADKSNLSADEKATLESMEKANILVYPLTDENKAVFDKEKADLETILKSENYKLLMKAGSEEGQLKLMYEGDPESIDEVIVFGSSEEMGFGVARILGENMNPGEIMKLMKSLDSTSLNIKEIKGLTDIFKSKKDSLKISN